MSGFMLLVMVFTVIGALGALYVGSPLLFWLNVIFGVICGAMVVYFEERH